MDFSKLPYADRPEVSETYVNNVHEMMFDGRTLNVTFAVARPEVGKPGQQHMSGKRYTAARLVLSADAAQDLLRKLQEMALRMKAEPSPATKQ